jgi:sirohydrochlorin cobaltochelatase
MHGVPPSDFPRQDMIDFFSLEARLMTTRGEERAALKHRFEELESKMRAWPRTERNDPFHAGSHMLARHLSQATGWEVIVAFNEYCGPSTDDALEQAAAQEAEKIIVLTPMMTRGGEHSEMEIPESIAKAQARHPQIPMVYVWPFDVGEVAQFLAEQTRQFLQGHDHSNGQMN